jgi:peptidoglycan/LPS O-acetylase OafA/YrhL
MLGWGADAAFGRPLDDKSLLIRLAYTAALEALGGYITARLARRKPTVHAVILGALMIAATLPVTVLAWSTTPAWYSIWALLLILPMTILGSHIHEMSHGE